MKLHIKPVSVQNRTEILSLHILPEQKGYIETIEQCLEEAALDKRWHPVGIYDENTLIGFAMYGFFLEEYFPAGRLWLDRFLIDFHFQGKGYGKAALNEMLHQLSALYPNKKIYLSVIADNTVAIKLYQSFGFHFIGEKDIHNEDVMVK